MLNTRYKIQNTRYKPNGFTLVELLIYTGISVIIGGLTVGTLLTVTKINQNASATSEVSGQMNFVLQRLQQLVSESSNIDIDAGVTTSTVKLRMQDSTKDPTCISLASGTIKIAEGPGSNPNDCNSTVSDLTNSKVIVNTLNFKKFVQYPGHDTLSLDMTMTYNSNNLDSQVSRSLSSAIARVSAATFDSNMLPGASTYTIGQSGSPWQNIFVGDGSAASPSYSFGNSTNAGLFKVSGTSTLGFATAGTERMRIDDSGNVGIGTSTPASLLTVAGAIRSTTGGFIFPDATVQTTAATGANYWALNGSSLYASSTSYYVGIGTTTPAYPLTVAGTIYSSSGGIKFPDGTTQITSATGKDGTSEANAAKSCLAILEDGFSTGSGVYWLKPSPSTGGAFQVYCEMETDGGGWTYLGHVNSDYTAGRFFNNNIGTYQTNLADGATTYSKGSSILPYIQHTQMMVLLDTSSTAVAVAANKIVTYQYPLGTPHFNIGPIACPSFDGNTAGYFSYRISTTTGAFTDGGFFSCTATIWYPYTAASNYLSLFYGSAAYGNYWGTGMGGDNSWNHDGWWFVR